ncbi:MAG TPA: hypothetical protein PKW80_15690 [Bacteroidales bacterium]|nr:hypothetical protein [Bacteroidales bacterium]
MNHNRDIVITKLKLAVILFFVAFISFNECQSQNIGINNDGTAPHKSALLDLKSNNKGFLVPRISLISDTDAVTIASPAHSMFIYNTNELLPFGKTFYYNEKDSINPHWVPFFQKYDAWHTIGNTGTTPGPNFLGTIDEKDFIIKTFGSERMKFDKNGGTTNHTLSITSRAKTFDGVNINTDSVTSGNGLKISANALTNGNGLKIFSNSTAGLTGEFTNMLQITKNGTNVNPDHISCGILAMISNAGEDSNPFSNGYTSNYGGSFLLSGAHFSVGVDSYVLGVQDSNQQRLTGNNILIDGNNNMNPASWTTGLYVTCIGNSVGAAHGLNMTVDGSRVMEGIQTSVHNDTLGCGTPSHGVSCGISGYAPKNSGEHAAGLFTNGITSTTATSDSWKYAVRATSTGEFSGTNIGGFFSAYGAPEGRNFALIIPQKSDSSQWGGWVGIGTIKPERLLHVNGTVRVGGFLTRGRIEIMANGGYVSLNAGNNYLGGEINLLLPTTIGNAGDFLQVTPITADSATLSWAAPTTGWALTGNSGTNPTANFFGTSDPADLVIKTNNNERMRIGSGGNVGIGTTIPNSLLHVAGEAQVGTANVQEGKLSFYNTGGSNAITLKAPTGATATEYTLPSADGAAGQALTTDGTGILQWTAVSPSLSSVSEACTADVTMTNANTYYTGTSVNLSSGTWLVIGHITVARASSALIFYAKMTNGTTNYASGQGTVANTSGYATTVTISAIITLTSATTVYLQGASNVANQRIKAALVTNGAGNNATMLNAIKIAP